MTAPPDRASGDGAELLSALKMAEERWRDLGDVIREHGKYDNAGFCTATANRLRKVIDAASPVATREEKLREALAWRRGGLVAQAHGERRADDRPRDRSR